NNIIINSTFDSNSATGSTSNGGAIRIRNPGTFECTQNIFINNSAANGGAIFIGGMAASGNELKYNVFVNNTATNGNNGIVIGTTVQTYKNRISFDYNWWGENDVDFTKIHTANFNTPTKYAQLKLTVEPTEIETTGTSNIATSFVWNDETTADIDKLPVRTVKYTSNGTLSETDGDVGLTSVFSSGEVGTYYVNASVDNEELTASIDVAQGALEGDWYVSESGDDTNNNGKTRETAFKTIYKAVSSAAAGDTIVVLAGTYERSTITSLSKDVTIIGEGDVILTRPAGAYFSSSSSLNIVLKGLTFKNCDSTSGYSATTMPAALNLVQTGCSISIIDCNCIDNKGQSIVRTRANTEITGCTFIGNDATGNTNAYSATYTDGFIDFSATSGKTLTMNYNLFVNNVYEGSNKFIVSNGGTGNIDYNYWGSNGAITNFDSTKFTLNNYVVINTTINDVSFELNNQYDVAVNFNSTTDGVTLAIIPESMPDLTVDIVKTIGAVNPETVTISDNTAKAVYTASAQGDEEIDVNYNSKTLNSLTFYVDEIDDGSKFYVDQSYTGESDGSKDKPFKNIQDALSEGQDKPIIVIGNDNPYSVDNYYTISNNVNITGRGNVVLTRTGEGYLFYSYPTSAAEVYNITLKNVVIRDITSNYGIIYYQGKSVFDYNTYQSTKYYATLTMDNCTVRNNDGTYTIYAYDYYNINITNTNFLNNTANYLIYAGSNGQFVHVNYNNFIGNDISRYYVNIQAYSNMDGDLNYNFWGNNSGVPLDSEGYKMVSSSYAPDKWVIVDASIDTPTYAETDNTVTLEFKANTGDLDKAMPIATFDLTAVNGTVSETVTLTNNVGTATYSSSKEGEDTITVSAFDDEITTLEFTVEESVAGKLFVNQSYTGGSNDGSKEKPYTTVKDALDAAKTSDANQIIIFDGTYTDLTSRYTISKSLSLVGRGDNVVLKNVYELNYGSNNLNVSGITFTGTSASTNALFYSSTSNADLSLNIYNCSFINYKTTYCLIDIKMNLNLTKVNVIDCTFTTTSTNYPPIRVYNSNPTVYIGYSNFVNNSYKTPLFIMSQSEKVTADYNFWGSNEKPTSSLLSPYVLNKVNKWVVINASIDNETINKDNSYNLNFKFQSTTADGTTFTDLDDTMPVVSFDLVSALGNTFGDSTITMADNKATTTYTANNDGDEVINITHTAFVTNLTFEVIGEAVIIDTNLTVDPTSLELTVGDSAAITADVLPDTLTPTYSSSNESVATVDASGNVVAVGVGSAIISVSVGDGVTYAVNTTTVAVTVKKSASITGSDKDGKVMDVGKTTYWNVFLDPSEAGELTFTIANESVIKIANGQITSLKAGNTTVNASFAGNDEYAAVYKIIEVTVNMADTTVYVNPTSESIEVGEEYTITAYVMPSGAGMPTFKSDNESVATVDANGKVTGVAVGTAVITVTVGDGINYAVKSAEVTIYVEEPWVNPYYYNSTPNATSMNYIIGKDGIITVTAVYDLGWAEALDGEPMYIYIDGTQNYQREQIDGVKANATSFTFNLKDLWNLELTVGTHNISFGPDIQRLTVALYDGDNYTFNVIKVTVTDEPVVINTTINVDPTSLELTVGENATINATLSPSEAGNVTFTSSDENVVTVDADGKVTAVGEGNATITVSFAGNEQYNAANNVTINVTVDLNAASVSADNIELSVGDNVTVVLITSPEGLDVTYTVADDGIVSVDENGTVIGLKAGNTTIVLSVGDGVVYAINTTTINVTVSKIATSIDVENSLTLNVSDTQVIEAIITPNNAEGNLTYESDNVDVVTVDNNGKITAISNGTAIITVKYVENDKYLSSNATISVTVNNKEEPIITKKDLNASIFVDPVKEGEDANIVISGLENATGNVTANVNGENYTASIENGTATITVPNVDENVTAVITYPGDENYNNFTDSADIIVTPKDKENATINITAPAVGEGENATVTVSLPADATGNVIIGNETVPVVNGTASAVVSGLPVGNNSVPVVYSGDDKYNPIETVANVTVDKKDVPKENVTMDIDAPEVTEGDDATITVSLPEDATGNVTATVDGVNYTAPVVNGTATISIPDLAAGNYSVPVTYSGDDKYNPVTEDVALSVEEDTSDIISAPDVTKYYHGSERFVVNITDYKGNPIANKSVVMTINGVSYTRTTD
ncbi:MAG: Ig-like domain-containing protein, partial [Methanobrevibacter sp.]|nr:Ig-like domain-containing protein [Methanobrevibacter sp.]